MSSNEDRLAAQIKAIVEAGEIDNSIGERPLTLDELKELAISMGNTEEQWQAMLANAKEKLKLADDHLKARNFKEAISEGEQAIAINPYMPNCNAILAKAYMMLWTENYDPETRKKAEYHARKELLVDPHDQQAVMVLSTLNKKSEVLERDNSSRKKIFIAAGIGILAILLLLFFLINRNSVQKEIANNQAENTELTNLKNQLIVAEEEVNAKWDLVIVAIDQRNRMIPDLFAAVKSSPTELVTLDSTIKALQQEISTSDNESRIALESTLDAKIKTAKDLVKQYAEFSAVEKLLVQIEGSENRIAFEKKSYNDAVKNYNILVKQNSDKFPDYQIKQYFNER